MLQNFLNVALRGFARNKFFTAIHVLGLSIGISASLVIFLIIRYEWSFNQHQPDGERIYHVVMDMKFNGQPGTSSAVPAPLPNAIASEVSGVELTVPVMQFQGDASVKVLVERSSGEPLIIKKQPDVVFTNPDYFAMNPHEFIIGAPEVLYEPFGVVLSESRARMYFPNTDLANTVGQHISYGDDIRATVAGVVKDLEEKTDFTSKEFISYSSIAKTRLHQNFMMDVWNDWMTYSQAFVKLAPANDKAGVELQLLALLKKYNPEVNKDDLNTRAFKLQPLSEMHFDPSYAGFGQRTAQKPTLYGLAVIAAFLLVLACVNFINLSTAHTAHRAKEIGVRKTIGSSRKQLIFQFLSETLLVTVFATILSVSMVPALISLFSDFIPAGLSSEPIGEMPIVLFLLGLTIVVSLLAGIYPAFLLSAFKPTTVLKANASHHVRGSGMRKTLTVFQLAIAQFFVISAFVVSKQINFSINTDLGFQKEAILNFETPWDTVASRRERLTNEISALAGIEKASSAFLPPAIEGAAFTNVKVDNGKDDQSLNVQLRAGGPSYLDVYGIEIIAGRNVNEGKNVNEALVNEYYAKALGFENPSDIVGRDVINRNGTRTPIVGVMKNFAVGNTHVEQGAVLFRSQPNGSFFHVALQKQTTPGQWQETIGNIQAKFKSAYPESDFNYSFYDESIANFYVEEQKTAHLLNWAMGLSILISCLGLLGLTIHTSEVKTKEIGIRKVLGASVSSIVTLLSKEFVLLVGVAFLVASPLAWYMAHNWLEEFVFRTELSWWVFAVSGAGVLLIAIITLSFQTIRAATASPVNNLRAE